MRINKNIKKERMKSIIHSLPIAKNKKKVDLLFKFCRICRIEVDEIILVYKNQLYTLILLPDKQKLIDINTPSLYNLWQEEVAKKFKQTGQFDLSVSSGPFERYYFSIIDEVSKKFNIEIHSIIDIGDMIGEEIRLERDSDFYRLLDEEYYRHKGYITSGDVICHKYSALSLFDYYVSDDEPTGIDYYVSDNKHIEGNGADRPFFYVYSQKSFDLSVACTPTYSIIREISPTLDFERYTNQQRYIFFSCEWSEIINGRKSKRHTTWKGEENMPVVFIGLYKFDLKESLKEGLFVWRQIKKKIGLPFNDLKKIEDLWISN